jgi:hypothetical protein
MAVSIAKFAFLWTMFMISVLFGAAYAVLLEKNLSAAVIKGLLLPLP